MLQTQPLVHQAAQMQQIPVQSVQMAQTIPGQISMVQPVVAQNPLQMVPAMNPIAAAQAAALAAAEEEKKKQKKAAFKKVGMAVGKSALKLGAKVALGSMGVPQCMCLSSVRKSLN